MYVLHFKIAMNRQRNCQGLPSALYAIINCLITKYIYIYLISFNSTAFAGTAPKIRWRSKSCCFAGEAGAVHSSHEDSCSRVQQQHHQVMIRVQLGTPNRAVQLKTVHIICIWSHRIILSTESLATETGIFIYFIFYKNLWIYMYIFFPSSLWSITSAAFAINLRLISLNVLPQDRFCH